MTGPGLTGPVLMVLALTFVGVVARWSLLIEEAVRRAVRRVRRPGPYLNAVGIVERGDGRVRESSYAQGKRLGDAIVAAINPEAVLDSMLLALEGRLQSQHAALDLSDLDALLQRNLAVADKERELCQQRLEVLAQLTPMAGPILVRQQELRRQIDTSYTRGYSCGLYIDAAGRLFVEGYVPRRFSKDAIRMRPWNQSGPFSAERVIRVLLDRLKEMPELLAKEEKRQQRIERHLAKVLTLLSAP